MDAVVSGPAIDAELTLASLRNMQPGERMVYYTGYLARDRINGKNKNPHLTASDVARIAKEAEWLKDAGTITLVQRRLGIYLYEYIAVRTAKESPL